MKLSWAHGIIAFFAIIISINIAILFFAEKTKTSYFEENPSRKGEAFQEEIEAERYGLSLGIKITNQNRQIYVESPAELKIKAIRPNDKNLDYTMGPKRSGLIGELPEAGFWFLDVRGEHGGKSFKLPLIKILVN